MAGSRTILGFAALVCTVALVASSANAANTTTTSPTTATSTTTETRTETRTQTRTETSKTTATETRSTTKTRTITETPSNTAKGVTVGQTTNIHGSQQDNGVPAWAWVLIGLGVVAVVLLAVLIANGRNRQPPQGGAPVVSAQDREPPASPPAI